MTRKTPFFEGWSWFKFNNLTLALGANLKFYTSMAKKFKLKVRMIWRLIHTFGEVSEEKLPPPEKGKKQLTLIYYLVTHYLKIQ